MGHANGYTLEGSVQVIGSGTRVELGDRPVYKRVRRYLAEGLAGLADRWSRPHMTPRALSRGDDRPDRDALAADLTPRGVKLSLGGSVHEPDDAVGRLLFNVLAMVAEFEADLIRMRTRER